MIQKLTKHLAATTLLLTICAASAPPTSAQAIASPSATPSASTLVLQQIVPQWQDSSYLIEVDPKKPTSILLAKGSYQIDLEPLQAITFQHPQTITLTSQSPQTLTITIRPQIPSSQNTITTFLNRIKTSLQHFLGIDTTNSLVQPTQSPTPQPNDLTPTQEAPADLPLNAILTIKFALDPNFDPVHSPADFLNQLGNLNLRFSPLNRYVSYQLLEGWNLVSFPGETTTFSTAKDLIADITSSGSLATTIATWENQAWVEFTQRGNQEFGSNFSIQPAKAYFIRNHQPHTWVVPVTPINQPQLTLETGWNTIGFVDPQDLTASQVIDSINTATLPGEPHSTLPLEKATDLTYWKSGNWAVFVKRTFDAQNIQEYGVNYPIKPEIGYMIKVNQPVIWQP